MTKNKTMELRGAVLGMIGLAALGNTSGRADIDTDKVLKEKVGAVASVPKDSPEGPVEGKSSSIGIDEESFDLIDLKLTEKSTAQIRRREVKQVKIPFLEARFTKPVNALGRSDWAVSIGLYRYDSQTKMVGEKIKSLHVNSGYGGQGIRVSDGGRTVSLKLSPSSLLQEEIGDGEFIIKSEWKNIFSKGQHGNSKPGRGVGDGVPLSKTTGFAHFAHAREK